jgi:N utilization substance protein B
MAAGLTGAGRAGCQRPAQARAWRERLPEMTLPTLGVNLSSRQLTRETVRFIGETNPRGRRDRTLDAGAFSAGGPTMRRTLHSLTSDRGGHDSTFPAREVALQLLFQHDFNSTVPRELLERFIHERLANRELERFCLQLYDGVLANLEQIDQGLARAAENWRLPRMAAVDRNVLRLGAQELLSKESPPGVVINEAIELARRFGSANSPGFVNGVLDRFRRSLSTP